MTFAELFKNKTNENGEDEAACVSPLFRSVSQARGFSWEIREEAVTPRNSEPVCESLGSLGPARPMGRARWAVCAVETKMLVVRPALCAAVPQDRREGAHSSTRQGRLARAGKGRFCLNLV